MDTVELLEKKFPTREEHIRKIVNVFDDYYRINYINSVTGFIGESHFVKIVEGEIKEEK